MPDFSHAAQLVVHLLAVGGGFLAGYWMATLAAWAIDKFTHRTSPRGLHKLLRFLGGVIGAILVALILFGHGRGWNLFGGAAPGTGTTDGQGEAQPISVPMTINEGESTPAPSPAEAPARIRITLLGGADVKDKRFYRVNDEADPLTLDDLKKRIRARIEGTAAKPGVDVVFAKQNRLPQEHPAVLQLTQWLRNVAGLAVTFPPDSR